MQAIYILAFLLAPALGLEAKQRNGTRGLVGWLVSEKVTNWGTWTEGVFCPDNTHVTGFRLKNQPDQGVLGDDTAMNSIELTCSVLGANPTYIRSGEALHGNWGTFFDCPEGSRGTGYEMRLEAINFDNTAANNLALYCDNQRIEGNGHSWGEWKPPNHCPTGSYVCGIRTQIAILLPFPYDDTGLNNADLACCD